jgi:hypothetical protein
MANIGEEIEEIEVQPISTPVEVPVEPPVETPSEQPVPVLEPA